VEVCEIGDTLSWSAMRFFVWHLSCCLEVRGWRTSCHNVTSRNFLPSLRDFNDTGRSGKPGPRARVRVLCRYFHTCTEPGVRFGDLAIQQLSANPGYIIAEFSNSQQQSATVSNSQHR